MLAKIERFVVLSSITRTSRSRSETVREGGGAAAFSTPKSTTKLKVLPWPGSLSTHSEPSIISTSWFEMASPSPVPP